MLRHWWSSRIHRCRAALPLRTRGRVSVNVASGAAKGPTPGEKMIGAAVAGIAMFSRTLALEVKPQGIRVNLITPPIVEGARLRSLLQPEVSGQSCSRRPPRSASRIATGRDVGTDWLPHKRPRRTNDRRRDQRHAGFRRVDTNRFQPGGLTHGLHWWVSNAGIAGVAGPKAPMHGVRISAASGEVWAIADPYLPVDCHASVG
jgi:hypothetical protein